MPRNAKKRRNKRNTVRRRQGENKYVTNRATVEVYRKRETKHCKPTCIGSTTAP